jgi:hypothetical protein
MEKRFDLSFPAEDRVVVNSEIMRRVSHPGTPAILGVTAK